MIRKVARMGHPVLRQKAKKLDPTEISSKEIQTLIQDMVETMEEYGGIGIAAPQIHESKSLAIIRMDADSRYTTEGVHLKAGSSRFKDSEGKPITVFINPKIKIIESKKQEYWEGCLSVPGLRGAVRRPQKIAVEYLDEDGNPQTMTASEFSATVLQHELDHLEGILYVDRVEDKTKLMFEEEYLKYHQSDDIDEID